MPVRGRIGLGAYVDVTAYTLATDKTVWPGFMVRIKNAHGKVMGMDSWVSDDDNWGLVDFPSAGDAALEAKGYKRRDGFEWEKCYRSWSTIADVIE